jgi:hypothetical protein
MQLPEPPFVLEFDGKEYCLGFFRNATGIIEIMLYKAKGRTLKRGKRRVPVAKATIIEEN